LPGVRKKGKREEGEDLGLKQERKLGNLIKKGRVS